MRWGDPLQAEETEQMPKKRRQKKLRGPPKEADTRAAAGEYQGVSAGARLTLCPFSSSIHQQGLTKQPVTIHHAVLQARPGTDQGGLGATLSIFLSKGRWTATS